MDTSFERPKKWLMSVSEFDPFGPKTFCKSRRLNHFILNQVSGALTRKSLMADESEEWTGTRLQRGSIISKTFLSGSKNIVDPPITFYIHSFIHWKRDGLTCQAYVGCVSDSESLLLCVKPVDQKQTFWLVNSQHLNTTSRWCHVFINYELHDEQFSERTNLSF